MGGREAHEILPVVLGPAAGGDKEFGVGGREDGKEGGKEEVDCRLAWYAKCDFHSLAPLTYSFLYSLPPFLSILPPALRPSPLRPGRADAEPLL